MTGPIIAAPQVFCPDCAERLKPPYDLCSGCERTFTGEQIREAFEAFYLKTGG